MTSRHSNKNQNLIGDALTILSNGLTPFVIDKTENAKSNGRYNLPSGDLVRLRDRDVSVALSVIRDAWGDVFAHGFLSWDRSRVRNLVFESIDIRNRWAHQQTFDKGDIHRALDTMERLLNAISDKSASS